MLYVKSPFTIGKIETRKLHHYIHDHIKRVTLQVVNDFQHMTFLVKVHSFYGVVGMTACMEWRGGGVNLVPTPLKNLF